MGGAGRHYVEGANILTRTLITFAQGALRAHPWLIKEVQAAQNSDTKAGLAEFDQALAGHTGYALANFFGGLFHNLTRGAFASAPADATVEKHWYQHCIALASLLHWCRI